MTLGIEKWLQFAILNKAEFQQFAFIHLFISVLKALSKEQLVLCKCKRV